MLADTRKSKYAKVHPLDWNAVSWNRHFWAECVQVCDESGVLQLKRMFDDKDISHVVENFRICAGEAEGSFDGTVFGDGDFYKWLEAAMYSAYRTGNASLQKEIEDYIALIGRAQQEDGYLSTKQIIGARESDQVKRMGDINDFEVYNLGHMFTSACLHKRITGKDNFLTIAEGAAGYLKQMYEEAASSGEVKTAVCPSHYMGLIELYRTTGKEEYLSLAKLAIELRDSVKNGTDDNQDRIPLKMHRKAIGHAVRSSYLYAGVADLYAELGDEEYLTMMESVWYNLTHYKIYITGGCGALYNGVSPFGNFFVDQKIHQAHGYEYQLPNITAYNETCAAIGNVMWAYRMFLNTPKAEYFDIIERTLVNTLLAAISLDGKKYFYENMLERAKKLEYELVWSLERTEYITSYCCPPNLLRLLEQSSEYAYTVSEDTVWTGIYGDSSARIHLENGAEFTLVQQTQYPYDGRIVFRVQDVVTDKPVTMKLRIPSWVESGQIRDCQGKNLTLSRKEANTYVELSLDSLLDSEFTVEFDMPVTYVAANPMVEEDHGKVAVMRGPVVYCVESDDIEEETLHDIVLPRKPEFAAVDMELKGRRMKALEGEVLVRNTGFTDENALYQIYHENGAKKKNMRMIPYFAWDNRGMGEMKIWMPVQI